MSPAARMSGAVPRRATSIRCMERSVFLENFQCVDVFENASHCGECYNPCPVTYLDGRYHSCCDQGACIDPRIFKFSPQHCGECRNNCVAKHGAGWHCSEGNCCGPCTTWFGGLEANDLDWLGDLGSAGGAFFGGAAGAGLGRLAGDWLRDRLRKSYPPDATPARSSRRSPGPTGAAVTVAAPTWTSRTAIAASAGPTVVARRTITVAGTVCAVAASVRRTVISARTRRSGTPASVSTSMTGQPAAIATTPARRTVAASTASACGRRSIPTPGTAAGATGRVRAAGHAVAVSAAMSSTSRPTAATAATGATAVRCAAGAPARTGRPTGIIVASATSAVPSSAGPKGGWIAVRGSASTSVAMPLTAGAAGATAARGRSAFRATVPR